MLSPTSKLTTRDQGVDWVSVYIYAADTKAPVRADAEGTYTVAKQLTDHDEKDAESVRPFRFIGGYQIDRRVS